jgi:hypothetical protein
MQPHGQLMLVNAAMVVAASLSDAGDEAVAELPDVSRILIAVCNV